MNVMSHAPLAAAAMACPIKRSLTAWSTLFHVAVWAAVAMGRPRLRLAGITCLLSSARVFIALAKYSFTDSLLFCEISGNWDTMVVEVGFAL